MSHVTPWTLGIVMETDVMVAAFDSPTGASRYLLLAVADKQVQMLISPALLFEYEAVLTRAAFLQRNGPGTEAVGHALDELAALSVPVLRSYSWRPVAADPADDMVVETAINGGADAALTFNQNRRKAGAERFGIEVLRPGELVRGLRT
jgi:putative PIN family toxin of toxin-antitoxin system